MTPVRIGNASGFYGDRFSAFTEMLTGGPLDYLTGDYLAELTMGILGRDLAKDPATGYAKTFIAQMETCLGLALDRGVKIVVNAGGLNPAGLADALSALASRLGVHPRIGQVTGDRVDVPGALTANAYLGAFGIATCLDAGADVVVTGRVTDASLTVGPAIAHFGWARDNFDALAGATVAGHVIECGCQATGGNYPFFTEIADMRHPGFPIAVVAHDGSAVITKHPGTGGAVTVGTVTAQLLYEIGSPAYLGPDVVAHLDTVVLSSAASSVSVASVGEDQVLISGVRGSAPPPTLKVGVTRLGGFRSSMTFVLCGLDIEAKADLVRRQLSDAVQGLEFSLVRLDRADASSEETASALLRVHHTSSRPGRELSRAAVELALASYPGATLTTPPGDGVPFAVFEAGQVAQGEVVHVAVLPGGERVVVPGPEVVADVWDGVAERGAVEMSAHLGAVDTPTHQGALGTPTHQGALSTSTHRGAVNTSGDRGAVDKSADRGTLSTPTHRGTLSTPTHRSPLSTSTHQGAVDTSADRGTLDTPTHHDLVGPNTSPTPVTRVPLGLIAGARSGDKGGDANLGVWVRTDPAWSWLQTFLTTDRIRDLLPETLDLRIDRYELPNLGAINFVIHGLLGPGVGGSTRFDPQAKSLGEWLRARHVDIPSDLLPPDAR